MSFFAVTGWAVAHLADGAIAHPWLTIAAGTLGFLLADLVSGVVHWLADTWGSEDMPILGPALLRPFREHHVDPQAITQHDFFETNGNNCLVSLPVSLACALLPVPDLPRQFVATALLSLVLWVFGTNQFHKWAHTERPAAPIVCLQKIRLILPPQHHQLHHTTPFDRHYCITSGWMNGPLLKIGLFHRLERMVTALTGALPRR